MHADATGEHDELTTALVSSAIVFLITSIVFMFFGILCGRFILRNQSIPSSSECRCKSATINQLNCPGPVYEAITSVNYQEQQVNLNENIAYDSVQLKALK